MLHLQLWEAEQFSPPCYFICLLCLLQIFIAAIVTPRMAKLCKLTGIVESDGENLSTLTDV